MNPENAVKAAIVLLLKNFENLELSALNLAVNGYGKVSQKSLAFNKAKQHSLINDDGSIKSDLKDYLPDALAFEVNSRIRAGTFV